MTARLDVGEIAEALLNDGCWADVRIRTTVAAVHYGKRLIGRGPSRAEARRLREAFAQRRRVAAELARRYRA